MDIRTILADASPVNMAILLLLLLLSVASWAVIIERWRYFFRARRADSKLMRQVRGETTAEGMHRVAASLPLSPSGQVFLAAEREVMRLGREDAEAWSEALDLERRLVHGRGERGLPLLAIVASGAPFIGLLGTVWGVMIAFLKLGAIEGQPALEVVGPGIAEALIATATGLFAAIPAVVAYNAFAAAQRNLKRRSEEFSRRLLISIRPGEGFGQ